MHEPNFHVTGFSYGSNTRDAVERVSRSRAASDVAATTASNCILTATTSSRPIQARVPALLSYLPARDIGHRRRGHLQLEGKPYCRECLHGRH
jgi:hypothetical protein